MWIVIVDADRDNPSGERPRILSVLPFGGLMR